MGITVILNHIIIQLADGCLSSLAVGQLWLTESNLLKPAYDKLGLAYALEPAILGH